MLKALGVEIHAGDITDRETLKAPMTGVDGVFHVAAWYKVGVKEPLADQINVDGTRNVLTTMRTLDIPRGVYTSTVAVFSDTRGAVPDETYRYDGPHLSEYDRTKWIAHYQRRVAEDGRGIAAVDRDARARLRTWRHERHAHGARRSAARPAADDAGEDRVLLGARRRHGPRLTSWRWSRASRARPTSSPVRVTSFEYAFDLAASIAKVRAPILHPGPRAMRAMAAAMSGVGRFDHAAAGVHARSAARPGRHDVLRRERQGDPRTGVFAAAARRRPGADARARTASAGSGVNEGWDDLAVRRVHLDRECVTVASRLTTVHRV